MPDYIMVGTAGVVIGYLLRAFVQKVRYERTVEGRMVRYFRDRGMSSAPTWRRLVYVTKTFPLILLAYS